jgi:hypothetical protein
MADKTKAELEAENKELSDKLIAAHEDLDKFSEAGLHDLSWYQREIDRLNKDLEVTKADLKSTKEKEHIQKVEAEVIANDRKKEADQELVQYNQSEHTRFRLRERPSRLNIFGTPDGPVFDLGVDLSFFNGPVQIEAYVIVEMAQSIGMLTVEESEKLRADLAFAKAKNEKAALLATELTDGIAVLTDKFYADLDSVVYDDDPSSETDNLVESDKSKNESDSDSGSAKDSGQADGDNSKPKSDGVPDDSGNADDSDDGDAELNRILGL